MSIMFQKSVLGSIACGSALGVLLLHGSPIFGLTQQAWEGDWVEGSGILQKIEGLRQQDSRVLRQEIARDISRWEDLVFSCRHTSTGEGSSLRAVDVSVGGTRLATAGEDIRIWDIAAGTLVSTLRPFPEHIADVSLGPSGSHVLAIGRDGSWLVLDADTGDDLISLSDPGAALGRKFEWAGAGGALYSVDIHGQGGVECWDIQAGRLSWSTVVPTGVVRDVDLSQNGEMLAIAGRGVCVLRTSDGMMTCHVAANSGSIGGISFASESGVLGVVSSASSTIGELDTSSGVWRKVSHYPDVDVRGVEFDSNARRWVVLGEFDVFKFSYEELVPLRSPLVEDGQGFVSSVWAEEERERLSSDGVLLARGGKFGQVRIWDTDSGGRHSRVLDHGVDIFELLLPGRGAAVTASRDGVVRVWNVRTPDRLYVGEEHSGKFTWFGETNGCHVSAEVCCRIFQSGVHGMGVELKGVSRKLRNFTVSETGMVFGGLDRWGCAQFWSMEDGVPIGGRTQQRGGAAGLSLSADGSRFAYCGYPQWSLNDVASQVVLRERVDEHVLGVVHVGASDIFRLSEENWARLGADGRESARKHLGAEYDRWGLTASGCVIGYLAEAPSVWKSFGQSDRSLEGVGFGDEIGWDGVGDYVVGVSMRRVGLWDTRGCALVREWSLPVSVEGWRVAHGAIAVWTEEEVWVWALDPLANPGRVESGGWVVVEAIPLPGGEEVIVEESAFEILRGTVGIETKVGKPGYVLGWPSFVRFSDRGGVCLVTDRLECVALRDDEWSVRTLSGFVAGEILDVEFSSDGAWFGILDSAGGCSILSGTSLKAIASVQLGRVVGGEGLLTGGVLEVSPSGESLLVAGSRRVQGLTGSWSLTGASVLVVDVSRGDVVTRLGGHDLFVRSAKFSPTGCYVLLEENSLCGVWDAETGERLGRWGASTPLRGAFWHGDEQGLSVWSSSGVLERWDLSGARQDVGGWGDVLENCVMDSGARYLFGYDGQAGRGRLLDVLRGETLWELPGLWELRFGPGRFAVANRRFLSEWNLGGIGVLQSSRPSHGSEFSSAFGLPVFLQGGGAIVLAGGGRGVDGWQVLGGNLDGVSPIEGEAGALLGQWSKKLGLTVDDDGGVVWR